MDSVVRRMQKDAQLGLPTGTGQNQAGLYFDPQGADFTLWINTFKNEVYRNWIVPQAALFGFRGHVDFEFTVERDGSMSALRMLKSSGTTSLDRAAQNALTRQPVDAPARRLRPAARDDAGDLLLQRGAAGLLTRKRVVNHASAAWVAAVAGAWVVAAACRTMQGGVASAPAGVSTTAPGPLASVPGTFDPRRAS